MNVLWKTTKYVAAFVMVVGLVFSSGVFSVLIYGRLSGKEWAISPYADAAAAVVRPAESAAAEPSPVPAPTPVKPERKASVLLDAPIYRQHPELPSGCEITSLSMLLNFAGVAKTKMDLLSEMPVDMTPITMNTDGSPAYWGNPNTGFVGEVSGKGKGFGIYHTALFPVLKGNVPSAVDLTGSEFSELELQLSQGIPAVVWTTIDFRVPAKWVTWDTPTGPIKTTFMEHAVLLVGYDDQYVYVNDPWTGKKQFPVNRQQFLETWEAMGRQSLSYTPGA
jgi:uncharacterized protein YvpB